MSDYSVGHTIQIHVQEHGLNSKPHTGLSQHGTMRNGRKKQSSYNHLTNTKTPGLDNKSFLHTD